MGDVGGWVFAVHDTPSANARRENCLRSLSKDVGSCGERVSWFIWEMLHAE